ncbi:heme utilization cystosolic carrier protein HutX [Brucella thiophenivorans]|uniref:Heme utilization cystosolic carrier protein HutX n=1 Tax=Brucella thiophenivorans TaxID=571255 RepID=A0A256F956_9HYPH|nr:heme utilization cystosolic carrier protein HutX [Brucella thiophenivorans]OYR11407.1 hypothetical protein CEV31_3734 [Brucella thiophenivorans]
MQSLNHAEKVQRIRASIAEKPDGILESLATEYDVPIQTVIECVPAGGVTRIDGSQFVDVMSDIAEWGDITFICHSKDAIVEFCGPVPHGKPGHGMYNLQGGSSGLSGHLRHENCKAIFLVRRPFMGVDTLSVQFFNGDGETIFKVYVGRDEKRQLAQDQVERFNQLAIRFASSAGNA